MVDQIVQIGEARVNITWNGQNGDLPDTVNRDAADADVKRWVTESVRAGSVPGIGADPNADFQDFVVDRFPASDARPYNLIQIRPKTPFGLAKPRRSRPAPRRCPNCVGLPRRCPICVVMED